MYWVGGYRRLENDGFMFRLGKAVSACSGNGRGRRPWNRWWYDLVGVQKVDAPVVTQNSQINGRSKWDLGYKERTGVQNDCRSELSIPNGTRKRKSQHVR